MIYEVDSDFAGFRKAVFGSGVNIILAERKVNSTNSVGKSLFLECINFVLGADFAKGEFSKYEELEGHYISLTMDLENRKVKVKRKISKTENKFIYIDNDKPIGLSEWKDKLLKYYFNLSISSSILSWRNLFSFFYKEDSENDFSKALKSYNGEPEYKTSLYQSFLLDIAFEEIKSLTETKVIQSEKGGFNKYLNTLRKSLEVIPELIPKIDNLDEVNSHINKKINFLKGEIINSKRKKEVIDSRIAQLQNNKNELVEVKINNENNISTIFKSMEKELGNYIKRTFEEADQFHEFLVGENINVIEKEIEKYQSIRNEVERELKSDKIKLNTLLKNKFEKEDSFYNIDVNNLMLNNLISKTNNPITTIIDKNIKEIEDVKPGEIERIIIEKEEKIDEYREYLKDQIIGIYKNDREMKFDIIFENSLKVKFSYIDDSGTGKGNMKVLIYYVFLLILNRTKLNRNIDFIILDTDITDGVDSNNLFDLFDSVDSYSREINPIQLITTLRADRDVNIDELEKKDWIKYKLSDAPDGFLFKKDLKKKAKK